MSRMEIITRKNQILQKMSVEITKVSNEMYIVNGKSMMLENLKWKPQIASLNISEEKAFKQRLNADLFNENNKDYAFNLNRSIRN